MKYFCAILFLFFLIACSRKALPIIKRRTDEPKAPVIEIDLAFGEKIFTSHCNRCHDLPKTLKYNSDGWDPILSIMVPRAKLSAIESANVRAYIKANSAAQ
jgi:hypothetical protein